MRSILAPVKRILLQFLLLLCCYFISRCCFTLINQSYFEGLDVGSFLRLSFFAVRYDLSAICALNILYIVLLLLPLPTWKWKAWERFTQLIFITFNSLAFLFELSDWAYYPYNFKRATSDVLKMVGRPGDFLVILPRMLLDHWFVPLACIALIWGFIRVNKRICKATPLIMPAMGKSPAGHVIKQSLVLVVMAGLGVIGIRGGLQYIPIGLRNAVRVTDSRYVPVVVNTPFSIITSYATPSLEELKYMPLAKAGEIIPTTKNYTEGAFQNKNVVVIILESFSKEFTKMGKTPSYTPFLDSLMDCSLNCTDAYANAQTSAEGIPAIIAGIPSLMGEAFTTSNYGTNHIDALPGLLKSKGYATSFFHGGTNGTMSFDIFSAAAGYQQYFGRKEYHNEKDYDGNWGIWDEPYLQYFANNLGRMKQPFMASVFTLSSHPPYTIPPGYAGKLPKGKLQAHPLIYYTDNALRKFFATAASQPWFNNTLFVISADHCSPTNSGGYYKYNMGRYSIPILFYAPGDTAIKGSFAKPVQQLDILPTVLDYLHYDKPFFAFGNSVFRKDAQRFIVTENNSSYQWMNNGFLLKADLIKSTGLYHFATDSTCRHNLMKLDPVMTDAMTLQLQAFIQVFRNAAIHNKMTVK